MKYKLRNSPEVEAIQFWNNEEIYFECLEFVSRTTYGTVLQKSDGSHALLNWKKGATTINEGDWIVKPALVYPLPLNQMKVGIDECYVMTDKEFQKKWEAVE